MTHTITDEIWKVATESGVFDCKHYHPNHTCLTYGLHKFYLTVVSSYKYYILIHLIPLFLFKRKELKKYPFPTIFKVLIQYGRSVLFMGTCVGLLYLGACIIRRIRGMIDGINELIATFLAMWPVYLETPGRRQEIALFIFPRFLAALWELLKHRELVTDISNGENILFGVAMGLICYYYHKIPKSIKKSYISVFKLFWGINQLFYKSKLIRGIALT